MNRDIEWEKEAFQEATAFIALNKTSSKPEDLVAFARQQLNKERKIIIESINEFTGVLRRLNGNQS